MNKQKTYKPRTYLTSYYTIIIETVAAVESICSTLFCFIKSRISNIKIQFYYVS